MAKVPSKKSVIATTTINYFKLPFEVHYSEQIPLIMMDLKSDITVKKFEDVKVAHKELGASWGATFLCSQNNGPELYCCINNFHDEAAPTWLELLNEEGMEMNYGCDYAVLVEGKEIKFVELSSEQEDVESDEYLDVQSMDHCCSSSFLVYELDRSCPDYLILDANSSRVKVNLDGYVLDDDEMPTEDRIFNPEELDPDEFGDYSRQELWDAKSEWIQSILEEDFPKQKGKLRLSSDTE